MIAQGLLRVEVRHAQRLFAENAEEAFHLIEPRRAGRGVVEADQRVGDEPGAHGRGAMGRGIVENDVQLAAWVRPHDFRHEGKEVSRGMPSAEPMRDVASRDFEGGVQIDDPVALVVVRVPHGASGTQRERPLGPLQRLDRRLLVHAQDHRVLGGMEVEPHDVAHLRDEVWVTAHLVRAHAMGLESVAPQEIGHAAARQADLFREQARRPATAARRWGRHGQLDHALDGRGGDGVIRAPALRPRGEAGDAAVEKPAPNPRHGLSRQLQPSGDVGARHALGTPQHNMRAPDHMRRVRCPRHELLQLAPLFRREPHHHPPPSHATLDARESS
jgi:hypothetical protein